jgi:hypothetical protein
MNSACGSSLRRKPRGINPSDIPINKYTQNLLSQEATRQSDLGLSRLLHRFASRKVRFAYGIFLFSDNLVEYCSQIADCSFVGNQKSISYAYKTAVCQARAFLLF